MTVMTGAFCSLEAVCYPRTARLVFVHGRDDLVVTDNCGAARTSRVLTALALPASQQAPACVMGAAPPCSVPPGARSRLDRLAPALRGLVVRPRLERLRRWSCSRREWIRIPPLGPVYAVPRVEP